MPSSLGCGCAALRRVAAFESTGRPNLLLRTRPIIPRPFPPSDPSQAGSLRYAARRAPGKFTETPRRGRAACGFGWPFEMRPLGNSLGGCEWRLASVLYGSGDFSRITGRV